MIEIRTKPTRRQLMQGISTLQDLIGEASSLHADDKNTDGYERAQKCLREAHHLCIELRSHDAITGSLRKFTDSSQK